MIKGIIFDLDGVLVSTDEMHYLAWKQLAEEIGITGFTKKDNERQRGVSRMESLEVVLEKSSRKYTEEEKRELAERKNGYYKNLLETMDESVVLPGVKEALLTLRNKGLLLAVGSSSKNAPAILEKTGIGKMIDELSCGLDITKSKPDPEVFLVAAKKLGLSPEECLVVEDAKSGILAAKRGCMKSLAVGPFYESIEGDFCSPMLSTVDNWDEILN